MRMRTVFTWLVAGTVAVSAMSLSASAAITNSNNPDGHYQYDITLPEGRTFADIYGVEATFEGRPSEGETNIGAFAFQSNSVQWNDKQIEFSITEGEKPLTISADNKVKYVSDTPLFAASDQYAQVFVAQWSWTDDHQIDFSVTNVTILGQDGNPLTAAGEETTTTASTTTTAAGTTTTTAGTTATAARTATGSTASTTAAKTGDAGVGIAVAALAAALAAAFAARKKK